MSKNDGGPAFPLTEDAVNYRNRDFAMQGMSLRDYFAAAALQGILSGRDAECGPYAERIAESDAAATAYNFADAMLEARNK